MQNLTLQYLAPRLLLVWLILNPLLAHAANEHITLQLKWKHAFQFAGFYMALEKGYYREVGLDVTLIEGGPGRSSVEHVLKNLSAYGVTSTGALLQRSQGKPIKALGAIFQHSPLALMTLKQSAIKTIADLRGRRIMLQTGAQNADLLAALKAVGIFEHDFIRQNISYNIQDLITGKTDAYSIYVTDQPHQLDLLHVPYQIFHPNDHGIDFYGDIIITSDTEIHDHPQRVKAFMQATIRGWHDALEHVDEAIDLILLKYNSQHFSHQHLRFEANESAKLIMPDMVQVGYMNPYRWQRIAKVYADLGLMPADYPLADFIYHPAPDIADWIKHYLWPLIVVSLLFVLLVFGLSILILRRTVRVKTADLEQSEGHLQLFHHLIDKSNDATFMIEAESGRFIEANNTAARNLGYSRDTLLKMGVMDISEIPNNHSWQQHVTHVRQAGGLVFETHHHRKDGSTFPVEISVSDITVGKRRLILAVARDITERKQAELEQMRITLRYQNLFKYSHDAIFILDLKQGTIIDINNRVTVMLGYERHELIGRPMHDLHPDEIPQLMDFFAEVMKNGEGQSEELTCLAKSGKKRNADISACIIKEDGVTLAVASVRDITQRKQTDMALQEAKEAADLANQAKSRFLAMMSHEIRTPLNGILGLTELMLDSKLTTQQQEHLKTIHTSGETLLTILNDVLDYSKMEAGQFTLSKGSFSPHQLIGNVIKLYRQPAKQKQIRLIAIPPECTEDHLIGDANRLRQILMNLLSNAIKFTESGQITLQAKAIHENETHITLQFSVTDTGIGISAADQDRLFEDFSQMDASIACKYGGTGLGLAISRRLIHLMGGEIFVSSETDQGSCFWFELALDKAAMLPQYPNLDSEDKSGATFAGSNHTILLAEDDPVNQMVATGMLKKIGFTQVDIANNGMEAVNLFTNKQYTLVLMDIQMPEMNGYDATKKIRAIEQTKQDHPHTPIIALTAHAFADEKAKSISMGMDDLITKPLTGHQLADVIHRWITAKPGAESEIALASNVANQRANCDATAKSRHAGVEPAFNFL